MFPFRIDARVCWRAGVAVRDLLRPCHGTHGAGDRHIVRRGFRRPPSYHDDRCARAAGHFIDVITNGFGRMADYRQQSMRRPLGDHRLHPALS